MPLKIICVDCCSQVEYKDTCLAEDSSRRRICRVCYLSGKETEIIPLGDMGCLRFEPQPPLCGGCGRLINEKILCMDQGMRKGIKVCFRCKMGIRHL